VSPVLETVTLVLERAGEPMRAREIHAVAEQLAGEPLLWTSVKAALAAGMAGKSPHFRRVRRGVYQMAKGVNARCGTVARNVGEKCARADLPQESTLRRIAFFRAR
jgi:hypothetical protein